MNGWTSRRRWRSWTRPTRTARPSRSGVRRFLATRQLTSSALGPDVDDTVDSSPSPTNEEEPGDHGGEAAALQGDRLGLAAAARDVVAGGQLGRTAARVPCAATPRPSSSVRADRAPPPRRSAGCATNVPVVLGSHSTAPRRG